MSLFGDMDDDLLTEPGMPEVERWSLIEKLNKEKEVTGIYISAHPLDEYRLELNNFTTCDLGHVDNFRDQRIKIAGIVSKAQQGTNRKGIEWGRYVLEDYDGSMQINLSAENFRKFSNYFVPGQVLFVEGISQRGYNTDMYFFKVHDVKLLDTVGKQMTKSITLYIDLDDLDEKVLKELDKIAKRHKGKHMMKLVVFEQEQQNKMQFISKGKKLNVHSELLNELEKLPVRIKIN